MRDERRHSRDGVRVVDAQRSGHVDDGLASRPDVREVVDRIDREQTASPDDLVTEIERFLRSQDE